jgi:hypothetical protein
MRVAPLSRPLGGAQVDVSQVALCDMRFLYNAQCVLHTLSIESSTGFNGANMTLEQC